MIVTLTPNDELFNKPQVKELYESCKTELRDGEFEQVLEDTYFYSFYEWDYKKKITNFIGCIYFYYKNNRLFVNAFANRGHHELNLYCFKKSLGWFNCDIYAEATEKTSRLCILRCGFKRVKGNLFKYERKL